MAKFTEQADAFLRDTYKTVGAETTGEKINLLNLKLGGPSNFYGLGGEVTEEMQLGCLEYDFLSQKGKLQLTLV